MIFQKTRTSGNFDFFSDYQLVQFFYIYKFIYGIYNVQYISKWKKLKDTFDDRPICPTPLN